MDPDRQRLVTAAVAALQTKIAQQTSSQDHDDCGELLRRLEFDYPLLSAAEGQSLLTWRLKAAASADGSGGLQDVRSRHLETARQLLHKAEGELSVILERCRWLIVANDGWKGWSALAWFTFGRGIWCIRAWLFFVSVFIYM